MTNQIISTSDIKPNIRYKVTHLQDFISEPGEELTGPHDYFVLDILDDLILVMSPDFICSYYERKFIKTLTFAKLEDPAFRNKNKKLIEDTDEHVFTWHLSKDKSQCLTEFEEELKFESYD